MTTSRIIAVVAGIMAILTVVALVITALELRLSTDTLAKTQNTLAETQTTLTETNAALTDTQTALAERNSRNEVLTAQNQTLETDKAAVEADNAKLEASLNEARGENKGLTDRNTDLANDLQDSLDQAQALEDDLKETSGRLATLTTDYSTLKTSYEKLESDYEELQETAGTAGDLADQVEALEEEIEDLKAIRAPLILSPSDTHTKGFRCTGSMEPAITCLDEARWVTDFEPEDIVVGTTIVFNTRNQACDPNAAAHRVIDRKKVGDTWLYWPKGDNNEEPDGCWIEAEDINSYIVEIFKDVRPENAPLRKAVNNAKAVYIEAREEHQDYRAANGCHRSEGTCSFSAGLAYNTALTLWGNHNRTYDAYTCWIDYAKRYSGDRPIPPNTCQ